MAWRRAFPAATYEACEECKGARETQTPCDMCPFKFQPQVDVLAEYALQLYHTMEQPIKPTLETALALIKKEWHAWELRIVLEGANLVHANLNQAKQHGD